MYALAPARRLFYCELARRLTFVGHPSLMQTLLMEDEVELRQEFSQLLTGLWGRKYQLRYSEWSSILRTYQGRLYLEFMPDSPTGGRRYTNSLFLFATLGDLQMLLWMWKLSKERHFRVDWKTVLAKFANSGNYHDFKTLLQALHTKLGSTDFSQLFYGILPTANGVLRTSIKRNYSALGYHHTLQALFEVVSLSEPSSKIMCLLVEHVSRPVLACDDIQPLTVPQLLEAAPGEFLMCHVDPFFRHAFHCVANLPLLDLILAEIQRRQIEPELYLPELQQMLEFGVSYCCHRGDFETIKGLRSWAKGQKIVLSCRRCIYKLFTQRGGGEARFDMLRRTLRYGRPNLVRYMSHYIRQLASLGDHEIRMNDRLRFLRVLLQAADKRGLRSHNVELLKFIPEGQLQMRQLVEIYPEKLPRS